MLAIIKQRRTLWILFAATLALSFGFQLFTPAAGGALLDGISSPTAAQELLVAMSAEQRRAHLWITLLLDIPYPFAYGGLFLGLCLRHGGRFALWLAAPAFLVIPVDLIENAVQIAALSGNEAVLVAKATLTPAKFLLFFLAAFIAIGGLSIALLAAAIRRFRRGS